MNSGLRNWISTVWTPPSTSPIDEFGLLEALSRADDVWSEDEKVAVLGMAAGSWLLLRYEDVGQLLKSDWPLGSFAIWVLDGHAVNRFPQHKDVIEEIRGLLLAALPEAK
ncbi:MAG: hypothetical protein JST40_00350 [Armatimonadetes bacterium]|nr:hypothetical protein [Armatimonadota bacterium]